jgi:hypothetical protein
MRNVTVTVKGNIATITIDISKEFGPSSSLKTTIVASTDGNQEIAPGVKLGLTAYKKA